MSIMLDLLEPHFPKLVGQQLAQHKLPPRAGIRPGILVRRRIDLHVPQKASQQSGMVYHGQLSVVS
jgi:hypothetical protein